MIICWIFSCYWTGTCWSGIRLPWRETEVTCKTNSSYIEWNVTSPPYKWSWTQFLSLNTVVSPIFMNQYFWTSQMSGENMTFSPVSMIRSDNVTTFINGTIISCTEYYYIDSDVWTANTLTTMLHILESEAPNYSRLLLPHTL